MSANVKRNSRVQLENGGFVSAAKHAISKYGEKVR